MDTNKESKDLTSDELDDWWKHLAVDKKEATAYENMTPEERRFWGCVYPDCSRWWNYILIERKRSVFDKAGKFKAHQHHEWKKGNGSYT